MASMNDAAYEGARELIEGVPETARIVFSTFASDICLGDAMNRQTALSTVVCRVANGSTSMYDGIIRAISQIDQTSADVESTKQTLIIITDGQDTSSRGSHNEACAALLRMANRGSRVVFLGANQDAVMAARQLGIPAGNALSYASNANGQRLAFRAASEAQRAYRTTGTAQFTQLQRAASM